MERKIDGVLQDKKSSICGPKSHRIYHVAWSLNTANTVDQAFVYACIRSVYLSIMAAGGPFCMCACMWSAESAEKSHC